jgi:hypothetical protein
MDQLIIAIMTLIPAFSLGEKALAAAGLLVGRDSVEPNALPHRPSARQSLALPMTQTAPNSFSLRVMGRLQFI